MENQPVALPEIRQDLQIEQAGAGLNGEPLWLVHDRIQNRFFRIGEKKMRLLQVWRAVFPDQLVHLFHKETGLQISEEEVLELSEFLYANSLTLLPPNGNYSGIYSLALFGEKSLWKKLIHSYLFFRIPLARPQKFLDLTWPVVRVLFTRRATIIYVLIALIGLYLVSRQWSVFLSTFASFLTLEGFFLYAFSLVIIKSLHELGHAFMARRYHVEVPTIGAAVIVMMPILYTDTSAAWRLKNKNHRLMIDMAGIFTELVIAAIATLFWVFLPEGDLRAIAFTTATLSWVMSLTVNLNPFMKFDGYYILSDALGFENLQQRGFNLAKWWMREKLFALGFPSPENLSPSLHKFIIAHAIGVWIYRFFLFLGIALLVYHFFFKLLGIFMFVVEMIWFVGLPIWKEIKEWWKMRDKIKTTSRSKWSVIICGLVLLMAAIPFSTRVTLPAILSQKIETGLFAPFAAQIMDINLSAGSYVNSGDVLLKLHSPDLNAQIRDAGLRYEIARAKLARAHANAQERSQLMVLSKELQSSRIQFQGLNNKAKNLIIRAPHDGLVVDIAKNIHVGRWINETTQLALVRSVEEIELKALANTKQRFRLSMHSTGKFIPDDITKKSIPVTLTQLSNIKGSGKELAYLNENSGSLIPIANDKNGMPVSKYPLFSLHLVPAKNTDSPESVTRGVVVLEATPQSLLQQIIRQVASVLVREAGV